MDAYGRALLNRYVNQNQFFRQIRNFVFGMTQMPPQTDDGGQPFSPTGIHVCLQL